MKNKKDKVLIFIIGMLIGAIIATSGFLVYSKVVLKNNAQSVQGGQMQPPELPDGQSSGQGDNSGQAPPSDQNGQPPEKPDGDSGMTPPDGQGAQSDQSSQSTQSTQGTSAQSTSTQSN